MPEHWLDPRCLLLEKGAITQPANPTSRPNPPHSCFRVPLKTPKWTKTIYVEYIGKLAGNTNMVVCVV